VSALFGADGDFANPSSGHIAGRRSSAHIEYAAGQLAELLGCGEEELVWTSGATESDNLAIVGAARYRADRGRHLITMPTEHKAVADVFRLLEKRGRLPMYFACSRSGTSKSAGCAPMTRVFSTRPTSKAQSGPIRSSFRSCTSTTKRA
jgi:cysteine sulfinate desulfinase/cysteine desulfurase-like protein